jgi:hypothetical protein
MVAAAVAGLQEIASVFSFPSHISTGRFFWARAFACCGGRVIGEAVAVAPVFLNQHRAIFGSDSINTFFEYSSILYRPKSLPQGLDDVE